VSVYWFASAGFLETAEETFVIAGSAPLHVAAPGLFPAANARMRASEEIIAALFFFLYGVVLSEKKNTIGMALTEELLIVVHLHVLAGFDGPHLIGGLAVG